MGKQPSRPAAQFDCPVEGFQSLISGKYRLRILWELRNGPLRYGELKIAIAASIENKSIAARVLSRDLEERPCSSFDGRAVANFSAPVPLRVEYSLTDVGKTFIPLLGTIHQWGTRHLVKQSVFRERRH